MKFSASCLSPPPPKRPTSRVLHSDASTSEGRNRSIISTSSKFYTLDWLLEAYIADVLDDRSVVLAPQRAEQNAHRDFVAQHGQFRPDAVFVFDLGLRGMRIHAEHERLRRDAAPVWHASDLGRPGVFRRLLLFEHIDFVGGLALLGDDGLLAAVNDEITSLVIDTLAYAGTALIIETI